jgi:hypothetical protein
LAYCCGITGSGTPERAAISGHLPPSIAIGWLHLKQKALQIGTF